VKVLVINSGSSSIKSCVYEIETGSADGSRHDPYLEPIWKAQVNLKGADGELKVKSGDSGASRVQFKNENLDSGFMKLFTALTEDPASPVSSPDEIHAVGHRVVHG